MERPPSLVVREFLEMALSEDEEDFVVVASLHSLPHPHLSLTLVGDERPITFQAHHNVVVDFVVDSPLAWRMVVQELESFLGTKQEAVGAEGLWVMERDLARLIHKDLLLCP